MSENEERFERDDPDVEAHRLRPGSEEDRLRLAGDEDTEVEAHRLRPDDERDRL